MGPISFLGVIVIYPKSLGGLYVPGPGVLNLAVHWDSLAVFPKPYDFIELNWLILWTAEPESPTYSWYPGPGVG